MIALVPHPSAPVVGWTVSASAERTGDGDLGLRYELHAPLDAVRVPPVAAPGRSDRLWEHTCAEAFVAADGTPAYVELNVSPSRQWAAYAFTAYRDGGPLPGARLEPRIVVRRGQDVLAIDVRVALADLSASYARAALRIGLTMVVEATDGRLSYWALHHASATPDFHDPHGFTLHIPAEAGRGSDA